MAIARGIRIPPAPPPGFNFASGYDWRACEAFAQEMENVPTTYAVGTLGLKQKAAEIRSGLVVALDHRLAVMALTRLIPENFEPAKPEEPVTVPVPPPTEFASPLAKAAPGSQESYQLQDQATALLNRLVDVSLNGSHGQVTRIYLLSVMEAGVDQPYLSFAANVRMDDVPRLAALVSRSIERAVQALDQPTSTSPRKS